MPPPPSWRGNRHWHRHHHLGFLPSRLTIRRGNGGRTAGRRVGQLTKTERPKDQQQKRQLS